uniref:Regulator of G-protein signaling 1 n=1 Tax=Crocodylus porosus TaxID=8502 RepID=A0A7M4DXN3_CROPO
MSFKNKQFMFIAFCNHLSLPKSTILCFLYYIVSFPFCHCRLSAEEVMQWSQSLEKLLASQRGQGVFREFLKSEFSEENMEFWLACEEYKKTKSDHLHGKAERIYEEFVQSNAVKQINIDYRTRETTAKKAQDPTLTSFDEAQKTVYVLMERDSYPRFLKSKAYLSLLNQLQANTLK